MHDVDIAKAAFASFPTTTSSLRHDQTQPSDMLERLCIKALHALRLRKTRGYISHISEARYPDPNIKADLAAEEELSSFANAGCVQHSALFAFL
jgi:hypothetical protein